MLEDLKELTSEPESPSEWHYNEAIEVAESGDLDQARALYTEAITLNPKFEKAYVNRASIYSDQNDESKAIRDLRTATRLDPSDWIAWSNLGNSLGRIKNFSAALSTYNHALRLKSDSANIWIGRGHVREKLGQLKEAESDFSRAIKASNGTSADAFANRGLMRLKQDKQEKVDTGRQDLEQALRLDPKHAMAKEVLKILQETLPTKEQ